MDQNGSLKANLFYVNNLDVIEHGKIRLSESIVNVIKPNSKTTEIVAMSSKLLNHAADFNFNDKDFWPLPCSMTVHDSVGSSKAVCTSHVRATKPFSTSRVCSSKSGCANKVNLFVLAMFVQVNQIPLVMSVKVNLFTRFFL